MLDLRRLLFGDKHARPWGKGKHAGGRSGGGSQRLTVARFLSRPIENPKEYKPTQAERNQRRNRRQRIARRRG